MAASARNKVTTAPKKTQQLAFKKKGIALGGPRNSHTASYDTSYYLAS
jgi:hypothetical protein